MNHRRQRGPGCRNFIHFGKMRGERTKTRRQSPPAHTLQAPARQRPDRAAPNGFQDRFLRSRISANTFQAGLPASPSDWATSAISARRNGLAPFSAPIVAGIVGLSAARSRATSSARAASALLFGSIVLAKRMFDWVYSWPQ